MTLTTAYSQDQYIELEKVNDSARVMQTIEENNKAIDPRRRMENLSKLIRERRKEEIKHEIEINIKIRTKDFIENAKKIHGDKYDYSKAVVYLNAETKICIICPKHGEFWQTQDTHLKKKRGCPQCSLKRCHKGIKNGQKKH